jgi:hypothetical protein
MESDKLNNRLRFLFGVFLFFGCFAFWTLCSAYGFERKQPLPIPPDSAFHPPLSQKGEPGFCTIQYDIDSVAFYWDGFSAGDGMAVYMDPGFCGFDTTYPFKITNVHFYLYDPEVFVWPVEMRVNLVDVDTTADTLNPGSMRPARFPSHSKNFTIPEDSAYHPENHPSPINLYLDTTFCVSAPFFLEIVYTGGTEEPYPSLVMSDTTDRPGIDENWLKWEGAYYEWDTAWVDYLKPGRPIFRITGYPEAIDCNICWRWLPRASKAPAGMPDFDQYQFGSDSVSLCGPTALANCLVWLNAIPSIADPDSLIRLLAAYFGTDPWMGGGTAVNSMQAGLDSLFADYGLSLYDTVFQNPTLSLISDSLKKSVGSALLVGLWQRIDDVWYRIGGHYMTSAGVCDIYSWIALSDPAADNAEAGAKGRILPAHDPHLDDHVFHNTKGFVSHDVYTSDLLTVDPYAEQLWRLKGYYDESLPWSQFEWLNFQPDQLQYAHAYDPAETLYAVVEYAVMILQKPTLVEEEAGEAVKCFELFESYPNPFNEHTVIRYNLPRATDVSLFIYNILGQKVRTLVRKEKQSGLVRTIWDGKDDRGRDLSSGIYFYQLQAGESVHTKKMVLLK